MLIYTADKQEFVDHVNRNEIEDRILSQMEARGRGGVGRSELQSWRNSMQYMKNILSDREIPGDAGVAIEYTIPQTSKRIDFILTGTNADSIDTAIIVELKQWESASETKLDGVVRTFIGGTERNVIHPSYQAWTYAALLEDFNESVESDNIQLRPCAYLHNCVSASALRSPFYQYHVEKAPVFLKKDSEKLARFVKRHVRAGDRKRILYRIENGRISPSRSLADYLVSLLTGNPAFVMIDDQKLVFEQALYLAEEAQNKGKQVFIIEGGPGTGKSVVAVNLLVELIDRERVTHYVTFNSAPREVYESKLTGTFTKSRITNLFRSSGVYHSEERDSIDALVVDEAHRLSARSGMLENKGENQIKEIIETAKASIFFLDEDQRVTWRDIGSRQEIEHWAQEIGATIHHGVLESQFRCNGSDGYLAWLDDSLQIRSTANQDPDDLYYSIEVVDSPTALRDRIVELNKATGRARLLAGYCWDWVSKREPEKMDIVIPEHDFAMQWNLEDDGKLWLVKPNSINEVGCIHTCQGLELDYVGVIIGPDLVVRDGRVVTQPGERSRMDRTIRGYKKARRKNAAAADAKADAIIKNTYRTLLSRGMKGCLIWCTEEETQRYFKERLVSFARDVDTIPPERDKTIPFPVVPDDQIDSTPNVVPVYDIKIAAGSFSDITADEDCQWVRLPDHWNASPSMCVAQVEGESMNRRIPNGAWCLFKKNPGGSRQGKVVLVHHRDIQDPDTGGSATIKLYYSEKRTDPETGGWRHDRIILKPDSTDPRYEPIVLEEDPGSDFDVFELIAVIDQPQGPL